ncbi:MAG: hypothetical protein ACU0C9_01085, partial [Paracoccaceae bacterium]
ALLPIGGSYLPRSRGGTIAGNTPTVLSAGLIGNILSGRLSGYTLTVLDGLGSGYELPANVLTALGYARFDPVASIVQLLQLDNNGSRADTVFSRNSFPTYATGRSLEFQADEIDIALLVPDGQSENIGLAVSKYFDLGRAHVRFGLNTSYESAGFAGIHSLLPSDSISGIHAGASWEWGRSVGTDQQVAVSGNFGFAVPSGGLTDMALSTITYNSINLSYSIGNVLGRGDRVAFGISLPQAIQAGRAEVALPVLNSQGATTFNTVNIPLSPEGRQFDFSIDYGMPLSDNSDFVFRAVRRLNNGNASGLNTTETTIGLRIRF